MEIGKEDNFEKVHVGDLSVSGSEPDVHGFKPIVCGSVLDGGKSAHKIKQEEEEWIPEGNRSSSIEKEIGKVGLDGELYSGNFEKIHVGNPSVTGSKPDVDGFKPVVCGPALDGGELVCKIKLEEEESKPDMKLRSSIEEDIRKVSLDGGLDSGTSSSEESESESSSSLSSSDSSSDNDEEEENKEKVKVEIKREVDSADGFEEGEIGASDGEMAVGGTDDDEGEDDETEENLSAFDIEFDEDDTGAERGPIRSKNEHEVLPPVPPLNVTLQPHHQMLPIGVVLSMIGTKVIVEGREQHNPLNEGSVLWITIERAPLGFVDEIFGPVRNPFYVVRYNSESEVPTGINEGTLISFVPEFANHILNDKNLYKKGYDASGENDEELSDEAEFSDDEKEAEYKRIQKMKKRGMNDKRMGNQKSHKQNIKSRNRVWKKDRNSAQQASAAVVQLPPNQNQHNFSIVSASLDNHNCSSTVLGEQNFAGGSGFVPPFSVMPQSSGIMTPSNRVWANGIAGRQPQNAIFPNGLSAEGVSLLSCNYQQQPIALPTPPMSMPNMMPYQQQNFDPSLSIIPNVVLPGGQSNLFAGPASAPWLGIADQNGFSQTAFGIATQMQGQQFLTALHGNLNSGPSTDGNNNLQGKGVQGNFETSQNFSMGASSSTRGKKRYHRGRGHYNRGRGHQQS